VAGNKHIGSSLDEFLADEGCLEVVTAAAIKEVFAWQVAQQMKEQGISKVAMAGKMQTSRTQLDRLLDPNDKNVTLATMHKAAAALGGRLTVTLEPRAKKWLVPRAGAVGKWQPKTAKVGKPKAKTAKKPSRVIIANTPTHHVARKGA
jgi:DNA-binding phage protein